MPEAVLKSFCSEPQVGLQFSSTSNGVVTAEVMRARTTTTNEMGVFVFDNSTTV